MPESSSSFSSLPLVIIVLFLLLCPLLSSSESKVRNSNRELLEIQTNPKLGKTSRKPKCCEMRTRSQCSASPRCRWCRSKALDDFCFSKSEAWRLPSQVFLCYVVCSWKCSSPPPVFNKLGAAKAIMNTDLVKDIHQCKCCLSNIYCKCWKNCAICNSSSFSEVVCLSFVTISKGKHYSSRSCCISF